MNIGDTLKSLVQAKKPDPAGAAGLALLDLDQDGGVAAVVR